MTNIAPPPEDQIGASLAQLIHRDELRFDYEQRERHLAGENGAPAAVVTAQTRDELALVLNAARVAHVTCGFDALTASARRIRRLAVQCGLPGLARVADHVVDCVNQCDSAALGAVVARLHRLGALALDQMTG